MVPRGVPPAASRKDVPGQLGGAVAIAGTVVLEGDLVLVVDDGVVVRPATEVPRLLEQAERKRAADEERLRRLT